MYRFGALLITASLFWGCSVSETPIAKPDPSPAKNTPAEASGNAALALSVGTMAPDIVGKDLDDEAFKLSDYRGKVVMLDFWGDW